MYSGFVNDIMFSHNGANRLESRRRVGLRFEFARCHHRGRSLPSLTAFCSISRMLWFREIFGDPRWFHNKNVSDSVKPYGVNTLGILSG